MRLRHDGQLVLVGVALGALLVSAGFQVYRDFFAPPPLPEIVTFEADRRSEDVRRGPVKITRETTTAPDGTKTTKSTRDIGPIDSHITEEKIAERLEIPVFAPQRPARTRYVGLGVNPLAYTREWRLRGGLTLFGAMSAGVALDVDPQKIALDPDRAFDRPMVELTYHF